MARRSKVAAQWADQIKNQPKKPRRKREERVIPLGLQRGQLVQFVAAESGKETQYGWVIEACKYDGGINVRLSDDGYTARYVCVRPELGDTIERLSNSKDANEGISGLR